MISFQTDMHTVASPPSSDSTVHICVGIETIWGCWFVRFVRLIITCGSSSQQSPVPPPFLLSDRSHRLKCLQYQAIAIAPCCDVLRGLTNGHAVREAGWCLQEEEDVFMEYRATLGHLARNHIDRGCDFCVCQDDAQTSGQSTILFYIKWFLVRMVLPSGQMSLDLKILEASLQTVGACRALQARCLERFQSAEFWWRCRVELKPNLTCAT